MKKKLKLNELAVNSFVTHTEEVKGGLAIVLPTDKCTNTYQIYCFSIHACPSVPADQCPTVGGGCPTVNVNCATVQNPCGSNPVVACLDTLKCEIIAINM